MVKTQTQPETQEAKQFEVVYSFPYQGNDWPLRISFVNKKVIESNPEFSYLNGFYEILSIQGNTMAVQQFTVSMLKSISERQRLEDFFDAHIKQTTKEATAKAIQ